MIRERNESEWQVNLLVMGIALGFWEVPFYDLKQVGNIDVEQHWDKAASLWYSSGQLFIFWKSSFIFLLAEFFMMIWCEP